MAELGEKPTSKPYGPSGKPGLGTGNAGSGYKVLTFASVSVHFFNRMSEGCVCDSLIP